MASSSPTAPTAAGVPASELHAGVAFSSKDVPITAVTVFCKDKAEVTRVINLSTPSGVGPHEVELTELPGGSMIDRASVGVMGSGYCTILHVSYSDKAKIVTKPELAEEEKEAAKAEQERLEQEMQRLQDDHTVLNRQSTRNQSIRKFADRFAERVFPAKPGTRANDRATLVTSDDPTPSVGNVDKALDWWAAKAAQTDTEKHRLDLEERKFQHAMSELRSETRAAAGMKAHARKVENKRPGRVIVSIDVHELGPIELEVTYMIRGATWSPAYDLRVDAETDSISCTYFGRVTQRTTEDWEGVALKLSTAEPTTHGTPPVLGTKTISLKVPPPPVTYEPPEIPLPATPGTVGGGFSSPPPISLLGASFPPPLPGYPLVPPLSGYPLAPPLPGLPLAPPLPGAPLPPSLPGSRRGAGAGSASSMTQCVASAPPPPPAAKPAVAKVESGVGGIGAVSFVIGKPAVIKSNGATKKLTVGELQLSAEVTHYVVPSKEPAAYLQAKATNDTDYLLLASNDVSIFFGNSFATKTSLESVSPGETFQMFLGIDPTVKVKVAPPRKTSRKRGVFSKSNQVTYTQSTSISNNKRVPVTCVVVDAMPQSANEVIKVVLQEPAPPSVSKTEAITDDVLVSAALEMFGGTGGGGGREGSSHDAPSRSSSSSSINRPPQGSAVVKSRVTGVLKSSSNHLAWVGSIAPQGELLIPFKYVTEWPIEKEIEITER